jgi:hypothetical protein
MLYVYVDESQRSGRYLLCAVVVDADSVRVLRRLVRKLLLPGQRRLHFHNESNRRRREVASAIVALDVDVFVVVCHPSRGRSERDARARCLEVVVRHVQGLGAPVTLILESRHHQDSDDRPVIDAARAGDLPLTYEHVDGGHEPLLWLPDAYAWLVGAGGDWRRRVLPAIDRIVDIR